MLLQNRGDEVDLLPEGDAVLEAHVDLLILESELVHQTSAAGATSGIKAGPSQHRLHEEADWEAVFAFEGELLNRALEPYDIDVEALLTQVAIHDALEDEAHPLLEAARIGAEQGKIEVKMTLPDQKRRHIIAKTEIEEGEYARKKQDRAFIFFVHMRLEFFSEPVMRGGSVDLVSCREVDAEHLKKNQHWLIKVGRTVF